MTNGSVVLENEDHIDARTSHAIVAAQLRGEARVESKDPRRVVRAVADELRRLGLRPNHRELAVRYQAGETRLPSWMREGDTSR